MPVIQKFDSPDVDPEDEIINLDNTVGIRGGGVNPANAVGDVMVVQALLELTNNMRPRFTKAPIKVDGICGPNTNQAIFDYQDLVRRTNRFFWVAKDGRIGPARQGVKLLSKQEWTIIALNTSPARLIAAALRFDTPLDFIVTRHPEVIPFLRRE